MLTTFGLLRRVRCGHRVAVTPQRHYTTTPDGSETGSAKKILNWFQNAVVSSDKPADKRPAMEDDVTLFMDELFGQSFSDKADELKQYAEGDLRSDVIKSISEVHDADLGTLKSLLQNPMRQAMNKSNRSLANLEYWDLYPKQIKKWLVFTKSKEGFYDGTGRWIEIKSYDLDFSESGLDDNEAGKWMELYEEEQTRLPPDLRGRFRFGVTFEEIKNFHPKIIRLFSFTFASEREKLALRKSLAIEKWKQHDFDTASDAIQIDILTQRIRVLAKHLQNNKQDKHNARFLGKLLKRRKGIMLHLKKRDVPLYYEVLREIKLRDLYELYY